MLFGDRLKILREDKNVTQKELGDVVGVSDRVIGYYESNDRFPKDENTLRSLADYFNVSVDYLLGRNDITTQDIKKINNNMLGERIKILRLESGLTQEEFGKPYNLRKSTISQYESGASRPDDELKIRIASDYEVSLDWLMGFSNTKSLFKDLTDDEMMEVIKFIEFLKYKRGE